MNPESFNARLLDWQTQDLHFMKQLRELLDQAILAREQRVQELVATPIAESAPQALLQELLREQDGPLKYALPETRSLQDSESVDGLDLGTRSSNALRNANVKTVGQLLALTPVDLLTLRGLGRVGLADIEQALVEHGLSLSPSPDGALLVAPSGKRTVLAAPISDDLPPVAPAARRLGELLPSWAVRLPDDAATVLSSERAEYLRRLLELDVDIAAEESGLHEHQLSANLLGMLTLVRRAMFGEPVSLLEEVALAIRAASDRDYATVMRYFGLDGRPSETLEAVGARFGVSRERSRQKVARFVQRAVTIRPLMPFAHVALTALETLGRPVTLLEWKRALPGYLSAVTVEELAMLRDLETWSWIPSSSWSDGAGIVLVASGVDREDELTEYLRRYVTATAAAYRFGAVKHRDVSHAMAIDVTAARAVLRSDRRWKAAGNGWFIRRDLRLSWFARRALQMLSAVHKVETELAWRTIRRTAFIRFKKHQLSFPPLGVTVRMFTMLQRHGVRIAEAGGMLRADRALRSQSLSATNAALVGAFESPGTALTLHELINHARIAGLSEHSARMATMTSPVLSRVKRGVYVRVGSTVTAAAVQAAVERLPERTTKPRTDSAARSR